MSVSGVDVPRETVLKLESFADLLIKWNRKINLLAPGEIDRLRERHIEDSIQVHGLAPSTARTWMDLGSGAGFPGLICAILDTSLHPDREFTLVESDARKCAFLREAIRLSGARAQVLNQRIEDISKTTFDVISARALAPLPKLLSLAAPFAHARSGFLFPKGRNAESELTQAAADWHVSVERIPSRTDPGATILKLTEVTARS